MLHQLVQGVPTEDLIDVVFPSDTAYKNQGLRITKNPLVQSVVVASLGGFIIISKALHEAMLSTN